MARHKYIYNSARWKRLRIEKLKRDQLCEYCPPARRKPATEVDHFKAIEDGGGPYDWDNLRSSCKSCHSHKTAHGEYLHGCDENGMPRDSRHSWNS